MEECMKERIKARAKATGDIVDVDECGQAFKKMGMDYMDMRGRCYSSEDLDFSDNTPFDYWTRLEHQYAGMAMQAILLFYGNAKVDDDYCAEEAKYYAHTLVEKLKEK